MHRQAFTLLAFFAISITQARSDDPPDPLRLVPDPAEFFITTRDPARLIQAAMDNPLYKEMSQFEAVRELLDSTNIRRGNQLLHYLEKELQSTAAEMLDKVAGGGAVLAGKFGQNATALLVVQGRDAKFTRRFLDAAVKIVSEELARQESPVTIKRQKKDGIEYFELGPDAHAALVDAAILVSNKKKGIESAITLYKEGDARSMAKHSQAQRGRKQVEPDPLAWAWVSLEPAKKSPEGKDIFKLPRNDANLTVLFGGWLDVAARSPFLTVSLYNHQQKGVLSVRMPAGRDGMDPGIALHVPAAGEAGALPLLEPKGVLYSTSYHMDLGKLWELRTKLFNEAQVKGFEEFDKTSVKFLAGSPISKLLMQAGPNHRVVVAHPEKSTYKYPSGQYIPAFAFVTSIREPEAFAKRMDAVLRSAAVLGSTQFKLKSFEEERRGHKIVAFRFLEDAKATQDPENLRFAYTPCYVAVRDQFLACSTIELCRELVDLLDRETSDPTRSGGTETVKTRVYLNHANEMLDSFKDLVFAQTTLSLAIPPERAGEQVKILRDLVQRAGVLDIEARYGNKEFRHDFIWRMQPSQVAKPTINNQ